MNIPDDTISVKDYAELIGLSRQTIYNHINEEPYCKYVREIVTNGKPVKTFDISILTEKQRFDLKCKRRKKETAFCQSSQNYNSEAGNEEVKINSDNCKNGVKTVNYVKNGELSEEIIYELRNRILDKEEIIDSLRFQISLLSEQKLDNEKQIRQLLDKTSEQDKQIKLLKGETENQREEEPENEDDDMETEYVIKKPCSDPEQAENQQVKMTARQHIREAIKILMKKEIWK